MFLGDNLLAWLVLALGGALLVGNVLALGGALAVGNLLAIVRPPAQTEEGDLRRAPVARSLVMAAIGLVAALWALATLVGA